MQFLIIRNIPAALYTNKQQLVQFEEKFVKPIAKITDKGVHLGETVGRQTRSQTNKASLSK